MGLEPFQWVLLAVAALSIGISKSGFSGLSFISIYIFTEIFGAKDQLGVALPLLIVADLTVFPAFRKYGGWSEVWKLLPPTIIGGAAAFWVLGEIDETLMRRVIGGIIFSMVIMQLLRKWKPNKVHAIAMTGSFSVFAGLAGGVATVLANAAGPIQQMYLLSKQMEKMPMIGVGARFFLIVNLIKLPMNAQLDLMSSQTLWIDLLLVPAVLGGVFFGKSLLGKIPQKEFEKLIVVFALLASVRLLLF